MRRKSVAEERPDLVPQWSPKNSQSPDKVSCGSHLKVWWVCAKGHEWEAVVKNRALLGSGCPYCEHRAILKGYNDLATLNPELAKSWSPKNSKKPSEYAISSNTDVWWICENGHEWKARVADRAEGHGCPYCAGHRVWKGYNDLATTHPMLIESDDIFIYTNRGTMGEDKHMGFRTLEISKAAELHIKSGQLEITTEDGVALIPIEDLDQIMAHGANIRLSTMDLSILTQNKVSIITLDEKYLPTAIVLPFEGHARQSKLMHAQIYIQGELRHELWMEITRQKIINQSRALSILGKKGAEIVAQYANTITTINTDFNEALAAKEYFSYYHEGLNRRADDPINSRLNYGYAVVRGYIARCLVAAGFHPTFGLHHDSQLNAFNLADDLIEPYRAMVDLVAHNNIGTNIILSKPERHEMAHVLHNACMIDHTKVNNMSAIEIMVESLKRIVLSETHESLKLPLILPVENMEGITE